MSTFTIRTADGAVLEGERRGEAGATAVVLLHADVADRRSWSGVLDLLGAEPLDLLAYDRRGFGGSTDPGPGEGWSHLGDLVAVLDAAGIARALLVGNSMGGALALDLALTAPERVAGLLLIAPGVSGMTDEGEAITWSPDPATAPLLEALERAEADGDLDGQLRLELHLWLDGPAAPEGRVPDPARSLAATMDRRALRGGGAGAGGSGLDAWHALDRVTAPGLLVRGDLDVPADAPFLDLAVERLPGVEGRVLPGVAHLPSVEDPALVAALVTEVLERTR